MAVKKREKRYMTTQERELRALAQVHQVALVEIAEHEGVTEPAINHHLKSLTPSKYRRYKDIILQLSDIRHPRKAAS